MTMTLRQVFLAWVSLGLLAGLACATLMPTATPKPTLTARPSRTPRPVFNTPGPNVKATHAVHTAVAATATAEKVAPSQTALIASAWAAATDIAENRDKRAAEFESTRLALQTQNMLNVTATAQPFAERIQQLVAQGYLTTATGQYEQLLDFKESFARASYYDWYPTDKAPTDFVIRTEVTWEVAGDQADWETSGCGFVFRASGDRNRGYHHYWAYLSLEGDVYFGRMRGDEATFLTQDEYGEVAVPKGSASLMLVVEDFKFTLFVNDQPVRTLKEGSLTEGELGLVVFSGTSESFGTRCTMTQIELWTIK